MLLKADSLKLSSLYEVRDVTCLRGSAHGFCGIFGEVHIDDHTLNSQLSFKRFKNRRQGVGDISTEEFFFGFGFLLCLQSKIGIGLRVLLNLQYVLELVPKP